MSLNDTWAKLSTRWYTDPSLRVAAKTEPAVLTVWPVLIAMAKDASSPTNTDGNVTILVDDLAMYCMTDAETVQRALTELAKVESLTLKNKQNSCLLVVLANFAKWQNPRGTKAERDERYRSQFAGKNTKNATSSRHERDTDATHVRHERDTSATIEKRREEKNREEPNPYARVRACEAATADLVVEEEEETKIRLVFDGWLKATNRKPGEARLTDSRKQLIRNRFGEGFTVDQLVAAAEGFARDPFHGGDNSHKKRFDTLEVIFKTAEKVEVGLSMVAASGGVSPNDEVMTLADGGVFNLTQHVQWLRKCGHSEDMVLRELDAYRMGGTNEAHEIAKQRWLDGEYEVATANVSGVAEHDG